MSNKCSHTFVDRLTGMGEHLLHVGNCARCFTHYLIELSQNFPQVGLISLHFQTRKLRFREGMYHTQGHTENKWRDLVLNPGVSVTEGPSFLFFFFFFFLFFFWYILIGAGKVRKQGREVRVGGGW